MMSPPHPPPSQGVGDGEGGGGGRRCGPWEGREATEEGGKPGKRISNSEDEVSTCAQTRDDFSRTEWQKKKYK